MTNDGWVLVAMYVAGPVKRRDPAAWSRVVSAADYMNHAILTFEEVSVSVRVLARRGLLTELAGDVVGLSPAARRGLAAAHGTRKRMSLFKLWDAADALIAKQETRPASVRGPTRSVFRRALESYGVPSPSR